MTLKEKIEKICKDNGFIEQKELADALGFNYNLFNRNINLGRLSGDMIKAFINTPAVNVDYIWLIRESGEEYKEEPLQKLNKAIALLNEIKDVLALK